MANLDVGWCSGPGGDRDGRVDLGQDQEAQEGEAPSALAGTAFTYEGRPANGSGSVAAPAI